jgi:two-component system, cell cycle sensor histidine kinase and response regulator CckA
MKDKEPPANRLKESTEEIRKTLEQIPAVVYVAEMGESGEWIYVSPQIEALLGYTPQEWTTQPGLWMQRIHPEDRQQVLEHEADSKRSGYFSSEYRMFTRDGKELWIRDEGSVGNGGGYYYGFLFDITKEKQADQKAKETERRHGELLKDINAIVWEADAQKYTFTYVSQQALPMLGYSLDEWYQPDFWVNHIHAEDREKTIQHRRKAIQETQDYEFEYRFAAKAGNYVWLKARVHVIRDKNNKPVRLRGIFLDITKDVHQEETRLELERHLRAIHKFEAVGRLAAGVAHDFNNLLMTITSYCELLKLKMSSPGPQELEEIQRAAEQGSVLTRHLLAFGGKQMQAPRKLDLNQVLRNLEPMLKRLVREDVQVKMVLADDLGVIEADPSQMEEMIINLTINAREAMPEAGSVLLETSNVQLDEAVTLAHPNMQAGEYVQLSVSDTGTGLDDDAKSHIFEPFYIREDRTMGAGLRLPAVYGIVKQTGGNVWVYGEPGQGTTFKIYLPRVNAEVESPVAAEEAILPETSGQTILVVDDNDAVRMAIGAYLEMSGFHILQAANGKEAINVASRDNVNVDLLITDLVMPQMGGLELSQRLAMQNPNLKVLYMSGYTEESVIRQGVLEPGAFFLQKPTSMQVLLRKVHELLNS